MDAALPISNLDRLNRSVRKFQDGGVVDSLPLPFHKSSHRLFPLPPPFFPPRQMLLGNQKSSRQMK